MNPTELDQSTLEHDVAELQVELDADAILPAAETRTKLSSLSIVLPSYNEAENVAQAVAEATAAAQRFADAYEVIVVNDGSADETLEIATELAAKQPNLRVVNHPQNRGYGAAVRSGIDAAQSDYVFLTDGDLQFDLGQIEKLLPLLETSDIVVGWRINRQDNFIRRFNAHAWNAMIRRLLKIPVKDVDCAFKLIDRRLLDRIDLVSDGAMISAELVAKCLKLGATLSEVGVEHRPRVAGEPSGNNPRVVRQAFRELIALRSILVVAPTS
jgi:glycosyltransferase involved in cell wall biosynthesis